MIESLLKNMVATVGVLKIETERANSPQVLVRIERLASLLCVQASTARAAAMSVGPRPLVQSQIIWKQP